MIKWNSNFQIEGSMIQLAEAYIVVDSFDNVGKKCYVTASVCDESRENIARVDNHVLDSVCATEEDVYKKMVALYPDSEIV